MGDWITRAARAAHWVIARVGAGLMVMLAAAAVVWMVFEVSDSVWTTFTALTLMVAFVIGNFVLDNRD